MKKQKKRFKTIPYPDLSIAFYYDRTKTLNCQLTLNTRKKNWLHNEHANMHIFARSIANNELLDIEDKKTLGLFCTEFLRQLQKHEI
jgi:hypothetical protein